MTNVGINPETGEATVTWMDREGYPLESCYGECPPESHLDDCPLARYDETTQL